MIVYLAAVHSHHHIIGHDIVGRANILESYFYLQKKGDDYLDLLPTLPNFILDSGAFTFLNAEKTDNIDWWAYVNGYVNFIKKYDCDLFFELDIELLVGMEMVEEMRAYIEKKTGKRSIPVWHVCRGKDYWLKMIDEYDYVAIGGFAGRSPDISKGQYDTVRRMVNYANQKNVKVHGLGFTSMSWLNRINWYSVDSTTWQMGMRYGEAHIFNGRKIAKKNGISQGKRGISEKLIPNNFREWVKFCDYAMTEVGNQQ